MPLIHTFNETKLEPALHPEKALTISIKLAASLTLAAGTVLGRVTTGNLWKAYSDAASDGTEVARAILQYAVATDADGKHYFGGAATSEHGQYELSVPAYVCGFFYDADLTGLDANGLADLQGRTLIGDDLSDANTIVYIP